MICIERLRNNMATEISTYIHEGMELPFEDWSNTIHSFGDLASIIQTTHDAAQSSAVLYFRAGISSNPEKMLSLSSIQGHLCIATCKALQ